MIFMVDIRDDMMIGIYGKRNICIYDIKEIEEQGLVCVSMLEG